MEPERPARMVLMPAPLLACFIGLAFVFGGPERTANGTFSAAKSVASMPSWGLMFLAGAIALTLALFSQRTAWIVGAFYIGGVMYAWFAVSFAISALTDPTAALHAWALWATVSTFHFIVSHRTAKGLL